jgi:hypothetical protein
MGFLEEIELDKHNRQPNYCQVLVVYQDHPDLADEIREAVDSRYSGSSVCRVLKSHGIDLSVSSLRRHRRQECRCPS